MECARQGYVKWLNFEMEGTNILDTKVYELTDKEKVQMIKNWLGQGGLQLIKLFTKDKKKNAKWQKELFSP